MTCRLGQGCFAIFTSLTPSNSIGSSFDVSAPKTLFRTRHLCANAKILILQGAGEQCSKGAKQSDALLCPTSETQAVRSHRRRSVCKRVHFRYRQPCVSMWAIARDPNSL